MRRFVLIAVLLTAATQVHAQAGVVGRWQTPAGDMIEVQPCGGSLCMSIAAIHADAPVHTDSNNPDASLRSRSLCNLRIGSSFHQTDSMHAEDGQLYDPKSGKTYSGAISSEGDRLKLRGYIGIKLFGRSETWTRLPAQASIPPCK